MRVMGGGNHLYANLIHTAGALHAHTEESLLPWLLEGVCVCVCVFWQHFRLKVHLFRKFSFCQF